VLEGAARQALHALGKSGRRRKTQNSQMRGRDPR
jgi:hypothetical protein